MDNVLAAEACTGLQDDQGELFKRAAGLDMVHVPHNGGMAALNGVATGQTSIMFAALPLALPYLNSERVRGLAVANSRRVELLPELPTLTELGAPGAPSVEVAAWYGVFTPNGVSPNVTRWLSEHISEAINEPATRSQLLALGLEPVRAPLSQFASRIYAEAERWGPLLKAARIPGRKAS